MDLAISIQNINISLKKHQYFDISWRFLPPTCTRTAEPILLLNRAQRLLDNEPYQSLNHLQAAAAERLVCDEMASPNSWPLARIIETYPGRDGLVRVVATKPQGSDRNFSIFN